MKKILIVILLLVSSNAFCVAPRKTIFDIAVHGNVFELQKILKMKANDHRTIIMHAIANIGKILVTLFYSLTNMNPSYDLSCSKKVRKSAGINNSLP